MCSIAQISQTLKNTVHAYIVDYIRVHVTKFFLKLFRSKPSQTHIYFDKLHTSIKMKYCMALNKYLHLIILHNMFYNVTIGFIVILNIYIIYVYVAM